MISVIVVDDGCTDGTAEEILEKFPIVHLLRGDGTLYWTGAVNLGVKFALDQGSDYVLIMNDDSIHDPEFVVHLIDCAMGNPGSIVGGKIMYFSKPDLIRFAGAKWKFNRMGWYYPDNGQASDSLGTRPMEVECLNGNCCLFPSVVFRSCGLFDSRNFPHCYADSAYTTMLRKKGFHLLVAPLSCIWDDDSDVAERRQGPRINGLPLIKHVFLRKSSPHYWRTLFAYYWLTPPRKIEGIALLIVRLARLSVRLALTLVGLKPFYRY